MRYDKLAFDRTFLPGNCPKRASEPSSLDGEGGELFESRSGGYERDIRFIFYGLGPFSGITTDLQGTDSLCSS